MRCAADHNATGPIVSWLVIGRQQASASADFARFAQTTRPSHIRHDNVGGVLFEFLIWH
jgi:hypothetical protein